MDGQKCRHARGDHIAEMGYWLCCDCWQRLEGRPTRYSGLPPAPPDRVVGGPQQIIWQAEIATAPSGLRLNDFLRTMTRRYMQRARGMGRDEAYRAAIDYIASMQDPFGDPAYAWTHESAREMADDDMDYWDTAEAGNG